MATGFLYHELYMWHNTPNFAGVIPYGNPVQPYEHAENPETKRRFRNLLDVSGLLKQLTTIEAREATDEEILRFHTSDYLEKIRRRAPQGEEQERDTRRHRAVSARDGVPVPRGSA